MTRAPLVIAAVRVEGDEDLPGGIEPDLGSDAPQVEVRTLQSSSAARALHEEAERTAAALVVVGSARQSAADRVLAGTTALRLLHGSPCPVAIVPQGWAARREWSTIGAAYAESDEGREALRAAYALAVRVGAALRVMTVVRHLERMHLDVETYVAGQAGRTLEDVEGEYRLDAERRLRELVDQLGHAVPVELDATVGEPAEALVAVSEHLDLLVCGSRAYGPLRAVLLGSVTRRLVTAARCPVLVLPRGVRAPLEALAGAEVDARAPAA